MTMYCFRNDYSEGAHPSIFQVLSQNNLVKPCGYGMDDFCAQATDTIRTLCQAPDAQVAFTVGGTQTNLLVIHALLHSYEAVIAATTGHVVVHETGAIEATGHKVCTVESPDGKLTPALVESVVENHSSEHMVHPKMVYISNTTEVGTVYNKAELTALRGYCDAHDLLLFCDGARLGSAITAPGNDVTMADMAQLCHVFTIGGTKNGLLFGEAIVLQTPCDHLRWYIKQRGAMLAKGWLLGLQFQTILQDNLYFDLAAHANEMATALQGGLLTLGCTMQVPSSSNQIFVYLPIVVADALEEKGYTFEREGLPQEGNICVRFVTSWSTKLEEVDTLLGDLKILLTK